MAHIEPDFSEIVEVTPGTYKFRVVNDEVKQSKAGNAYIEWKLEIFDADDLKVNGTKLTHRTMITGKGAGILKTFVKALTGEACPVTFDSSDLRGKEAQAVVVAGTLENGEPSGWPEVKAVKALV